MTDVLWQDEPDRRIVRVPLGGGDTALVFSSDETVCKAAYVAMKSCPETNLKLLPEILATRSELAGLLGHESFAHFQSKRGLAHCPNAIKAFLDSLNEESAEAYDKELQKLRVLKSSSAGRSHGPQRLQAWDLEYLTLRQGSDLSTQHDFFGVENAIQALDAIAQELFGFRMEFVELRDGEGWADNVRFISGVLCYHSAF